VYTLGINAVYHDPSACLVRDGRVLAAAEEERFTHIKHGKRPVPFSTWELPYHAIAYCLSASGIRLTDVDHVAYSYDPYQLLGQHGNADTLPLPLQPSMEPLRADWESPWEALFLSYIVNAPRQLASGAPHHLKEAFAGARPDGPYQWHFVDHHLTHAASAFHASPYHEAAVLTLDGRGERATTSYCLGRGTELERLDQVDMPHSLGLLYEEVTDYLGFLRSSDEYKVMALAAYGTPTMANEFRELIQRGPRGSYTIAPLELEQRFGPARGRGGPMESRHYDLAASLQVVLEETVLDLAGWLQRESGARNLCLAGGVALNCVMNARLRDCGLFDEVWAQPAAGDAGTSLGGALWIDAQQRADGQRPYSMQDAFLGPEYEAGEIEQLLQWAHTPYRRPNDLPGEVAKILAEDKIIGWFQGRMEFGPRALGARSILASPLHADMQDRLNDIKDREDFRPVAPVVIEEEASHWFTQARQSPFMLFISDVRPEVADRIPAVRHVDGTARIQTVNRSQNPVYYDLLKAFQSLTGVPVLVNTSFNTRGEPVVCSPRDALECFWTSPLDVLAIGPFLVEKSQTWERAS
jgi:carbamoyltransferase